MCNPIINLPEVLPSVPEKVKEKIYDDSAHPAAVQVGKSLETVGLLVNKFLAPIRRFAQSGEENTQKLQDEIQENLKDTPAEQIQEPPKNIAVPAVVANSYTDDDYLRSLYANLIANSMRRNKAGHAHPSFVEIIKQLTPDEALLLKNSNLLKTNTPICQIRYQKKSSYDNQDNFNLSPSNIVRVFQDGIPLNKYYSPVFQHIPIEELQVMINNFIRLNIIECPNDKVLKDKDMYQSFYKDDYNKKLESLCHEYYHDAIDDDAADHELAHILGYLSPTEFGKRFYEICVKTNE